MNGVTARVAPIRSGCVILAAMYAAPQLPAEPAALVGCQPDRIANQKPTMTIAKMT